MNAILVLKK